MAIPTTGLRFTITADGVNGGSAVSIDDSNDNFERSMFGAFQFMVVNYDRTGIGSEFRRRIRQGLKDIGGWTHGCLFDVEGVLTSAVKSGDLAHYLWANDIEATIACTYATGVSVAIKFRLSEFSISHDSPEDETMMEITYECSDADATFTGFGA